MEWADSNTDLFKIAKTGRPDHPGEVFCCGVHDAGLDPASSLCNPEFGYSKLINMFRKQCLQFGGHSLSLSRQI
jgi:hypothetical protein